MKDDITEMHAILSGRVQGVFFRATTRDLANQLKIVGTVRNVPDGTVEIIAQGSKEQLEILLDQLTGESGPGQVDTVQKKFRVPTATFTGFNVVY